MKRSTLSIYILLATTLALTACGDSENSQDIEQGVAPVPPPVDSSTPFAELYNQGIDRYLGAFFPSASDTSNTGGTLHYFDVDPEQGPMCFTGNQFYMATRDGSTDELLIFVEGGGACSATSCEIAVESPFPGGVPTRGIMNPNDTMNATADYNMAYIPYCDGSFFSGDANHDSNDDGETDRFFRGIQNLSASLDVIFNAYPAPNKIVLAGNSAGGLGTHFALPLVRKLYPLTPIELINDSGIGIATEGSLSAAFDYWGASPFFPESCETCIGEDGNLTGYHSYQLNQDDNLRMSFLSTKQDSTVSAGMPPEEFESQLLGAVAALEDAHPDRFRSLIANGDGHTFLQRNYAASVGDVTVSQWIANFITGSNNWATVIENDAPDNNGGTQQMLTLLYDGLERSYLLTVPSEYSENIPVPLLFSLHPLGATAEQFFNVTQLDIIAEREKFILVTPQGVRGAWATTGFPPGGDADDIGFINALIDKLSTSYNIDANRIYATGFSNGAFLSIDLACNLSDRIAAVAPVAGVMTSTLMQSCMPKRPVPILQTHGTNDPLLPYESAERVIDYWVSFNQTSSTPEIIDLPDPYPSNGTSVQRFTYANGASGVTVQHLRIEGGEHDWPGAVGDSDINMAEEVWGFLKRYDLNGVINH
ncbi:pectin acetylesterase-family hydrolase [Rheinheimera baltica]|uniref:Pectin acetylesterase-family hydrolase n=1 Tax=Rheinheimera baltica TaxID=67576 RepID=A0ABT9I238_9GAMM|nr:pectin acetylesterase-family hydrolase [Rheinheimera baltica]MDP5137457.1 pectin acetylesterase-family hydrolase [Rheinheimera baltica]